MSQDSIQALEVEDTNTGQDLPAQTLPVQEPLATEPTEVPKKKAKYQGPSFLYIVYSKRGKYCKIGVTYLARHALLTRYDQNLGKVDGYAIEKITNGKLLYNEYTRNIFI